MSFLLKNNSLVEVVYLFIRCNKTKFFLWNTNNTDRNGVNKQNTYFKHLEKNNIGKEGGAQLWAWMLLKWISDSAREASNDVNTFLKLRFIKKQKQVVFFDKILYSNKLKVKKVSLNVPQLLQKKVLSRTLKIVTAILKNPCSS